MKRSGKGEKETMNNRIERRVDDAAADFVADLSNAALDLFQNERGVYLLASLALSEVLNKAPLGGADVSASFGEHPCGKITIH